MTNEEALAKAREHFGEGTYISYEEMLPHDPKYGHNLGFCIWSERNRIFGSSNESWEDAFVNAFERQGKRA